MFIRVGVWHPVFRCGRVPLRGGALEDLAPIAPCIKSLAAEMAPLHGRGFPRREAWRSQLQDGTGPVERAQKLRDQDPNHQEPAPRYCKGQAHLTTEHPK